ncbi:MAG: hypothetical protein NC421_11025 [Lachnospiraceae bacterium]|nr:hypothetical protein [Lachnospiraceae bacterium]
MKKSILFLASGALLITSCSDDNATMQAPDGGGNVNFTVSMPANGYGSRAFADGYTATDLVYAVYDASNDALVSQGAATFAADSHETTVSLQLVNGKGYKIAFFAHKDDHGVYTFDAKNKAVNVDYTKMADYNATDYDAFYAVKEIAKVTGPVNEPVKLTRPLAQVNWGTNDLDNDFVTADGAYGADAAKLKSRVEIKGVYTAFDILTGEVDESTLTDVTFPAMARPDATKETFPINTHKYLSMNYVLVPAAQSSLIEAMLIPSNDVKDSEPVKVANLPVQANYRTNVYGALLTVPGEFQIVKDPNFGGDINQPITPDEPAVDDSGISHVSTPQQLMFIAENPTAWKGKTIVLDNDIDLGGMEWKPIGTNATSPDTNDMNWFEGTFDGKNHKISNFRCDAEGNYAVAGLFGALRGVVKNVTVENATITSTHYAGGIVAYSHNNNASTYGDGKPYPTEGYAIENCRVYNSTITSIPNLQANGEYDNGDKAGGIIGYACSKMTLTKCDVRNNTIQAYRDLGGIMGYAAATANIAIVINDCNAISNTLIQSYDNAYKDNSKVLKHYGDVYGWKDNVDPTVTAGHYHSNNIFVMNMNPTTTEELEDALRHAGDGSVITVAEGTYEKFTDTSHLAMTLSGDGVNFTVRGAGIDKTIMKIDNYSFPKSNITFEDMTVKTQDPDYEGFSNYLNGKFSNVKFDGGIWTWGKESVTYNNCEFTSVNTGKDIYPVRVIYTANATFNDCTVNSLYGRAFLMWGDKDDIVIPNRNVTLNNCTVNVTGDAKDKALFEIHTENYLDTNTGTVKINGTKWDSAKFGGGLWREINNTGTEPATDFFTVIVDGKVEQTGSHK